MIRRIALVALVSIVGATSGEAQVIPGFSDSGVLRIRPDGGALTPLLLTYMATVQVDTTTRPLGERSVQVAKTTYAGLSAWEIVETRGAGVTASVDSLVVDFLTLAPFHWGATQPMPGAGVTQQTAARVSAEFHADTMIGVMSWPGGRRTILTSIPSAAYVTAAHFEVALRSLPLALNWHDSTWVLVSSAGKTASLPASVTVTGEEKLLTPAGTFDCWVVALGTDLGRTDYWVSKPDHIVVQSSQVVPETGSVLTYQLSRIGHPTSGNNSKRGR